MAVVTVCTKLEHIRDAIAMYCEQRHITRLELDRRTGWADGYAGKLLGRGGVRKFSLQSVVFVLAALDLELVIRECRVAEAENHTSEDTSDGNSRNRPHTKDWRRNKGSAWSRRMNGLRNLRMSSEERSASARHAIKMRWRKPRAEANALIHRR
jgi:hypothetical protein